MLPKYLPPPYSKMFRDACDAVISGTSSYEGVSALFNKAKDNNELSTEAFRFVHNTIAKYEDEGLKPLDALEETYHVICGPR